MIEEISTTGGQQHSAVSAPNIAGQLFFPTSSTSGDTGFVEENVEEIRQRPARKTRATAQPKRRLRGFLIAIHDDQARVAFVDEQNEKIEYYLPSKFLQRAKVTGRFQPFELDEIEEDTGTGIRLGYEIRPMAGSNQTFVDVLDTDDELAKLRDAALKHFGEHKS